LLGLGGLDPLVHALVFSLGANVLLFLALSVLSEARPLERLQGALFVDVFRRTAGEPLRFAPGQATAEDLFVLAQRILGTQPARELFDEMARSQGRDQGLPLPSDAVIARLERVLAGSVGAASAHAMVSRIAGRESISMSELIDIADETQRLIETSRQLSEKTAELERTASQLREVNERLRTLDAQKDEFLSQVSHELRTPMTSIRSFSEILLGEGEVSGSQRQRFMKIIHDESLRLTRLLDEILDISRLEAGHIHIEIAPISPGKVIEAALDTVSGLLNTSNVAVHLDPVPADVQVQANADRLQQALLNLLSNAVKYNASPAPEIRVRPGRKGRWLTIDIIDNGGGILRQDAAAVFEKFYRGRHAGDGHGAGLGLTISRTIMRTMGGDLTVEFTDDDSSYFRMWLQVAGAPPAAAVAPAPPESSELSPAR
jgi:signal transduction histidine kinase